MFDYERLEAVSLEGEAPQSEPERQYYFMKKCREWAKEETKRTGHPLTMSIQTLGCQMNAKDSEKMTAILAYIGYEEVEEPVADFVLYNTCTVRENANLKIYGRLGYLKNHKKKNSHMKIALCGCMMQEPDEVERIRKSYPFVDLVFGTHNIYKLAEFLYTQIESERRVMDVWDEAKEIVEDLPGKRKYSFKTGVNIMYGCNNFCSYCIVPYVRGRERSREPEDILAEIRGLVADGVVEVMLLGQNVNSYGKTLEKPVSFARLLRQVNEIEGLERIRFMTSHPKDLSDELIEAMADCDKVCAHLHLPLQSGSSEILKKMNRKYTKESYLDLVARIRRKLPDISLTTDIIVGFPGETEGDFADTLDVVRQVRFDSAYTFIYSRRTGTPAAAMENQVPEEVVKERFNRLLHEIQGISAEITDSRVGETVSVLLEEVNAQDSSLITGRLSNNAVVHCPGDKSRIGQIVQVKLLESRGFYYMGEMVEE
ncbi:MAG: tRNA (N6-isopentenyl adenosine(37)-C2)-methylthiotransferase MiaB [Eubacterium sp.]|nr:tRNA (N6-isopentenyl adenosine(37)-C2)-methylthiotransferase MiaB [Eubacterium sp.]